METSYLHAGAIIVGIVMLVLGADRFIEGAAALARNLNVPPLLIGLTIVAFGTSAPEILVSATAAFNGNTPLAIGNAIGSNITNIALVMGAAALIAPLAVRGTLLKREFPLLIAVTAFASLLLIDGNLGRVDGVLLLVGTIIAAVMLTKFGRINDPEQDIVAEEIPQNWPTSKALFWFVVGLVVLLIGARGLVWGGVGIAQELGVSEVVIGLTIVAIGTSLPELAASIMSARKNEPDLAIGNIVGSNLFNLLAVLGVAGAIGPSDFDIAVVQRDLPIMAALTVALFVMAYGFRGPGRINRMEGGLLLAAFVGYELLIFLTV